MADSTIANLTSGSPAQTADVLPIQRAASTLKLSVSDVLAALTTTTLPASVTPTTKIPAAVTSLQAYGDSITAGTLQGQLIQNWAQLFAAAIGLGASLTNNAVAAARLYQTGFVPSAYAQSPTASVGSIGLYGANDIPDFSLSNANQTCVMNAVAAMAIWLALPSSQVILATSLTRGGAWSTTSDFGLTTVYANILNNTLTGVVTGTSIYIAGVVSSTSDFGGSSKFDVLVDGTSTSGGTGYTINNPMTGYTGHYPFALRFSGFSAGAHTIQVKVLGSSGFCAFQWIAANGTVPQTPWVAMGAALPRTSYTAAVTAFNAQLSTLCNTLAGDGLNVQFVDDSTRMSLTAVPFEFIDGLHPNNFGQFLVTQSWLTAMYSSLAFPSGSGVNGDAFAQILAIYGITPETIIALVTALSYSMFNTSLQDSAASQIGFTGQVSATATSGSGTLPGAPLEFLLVQVGANTYKIPVYNT